MTERKSYLDVLRIFAISGVVLLHCVSYYGTVGGISWQISNFIDCGMRWVVPVFVMISGALFLDKSKTVNYTDVIQKYVKRLLIAYLLWSAVYTLLFSTIPYYKELSIQAIWNTITGMLRGGYFHLWFLPMIIGLYLIVPILKSAIKEQRTLEYMLILSFVVSSLLPVIELNPTGYSMISSFVGTAKEGILPGVFVLYFCLGHYLDIVTLQPKTTKIIYFAGFIFFVITVAITGYAAFCYRDSETVFKTIKTGSYPNIVVMSASFFLIIRNSVNKIQIRGLMQNFILLLSKLSFGVYLIHEIIICYFARFLPQNIFGILILFIITIVFSNLVVFLLSKIKYINKYIL